MKRLQFLLLMVFAATAFAAPPATVSHKARPSAPNVKRSLAIAPALAGTVTLTSAAATGGTVTLTWSTTANANSIALICVQGLVFLGLIAGFVNSSLVSARDHKWAMEAAKKTQDTLDETHATIKELEVNTNSIKDALVKTTGEKAYAEGVKDGAKEGSKAVRAPNV